MTKLIADGRRGADMSDLYLTIVERAQTEQRIERSVFIGFAAPARNEDEARQFVAEIRELHRQATHNPFAYIVGTNSERIEYFHDHGEPGGTAGKPILGAIARLNLTNVAVVVTRYYGGKKLGVRGLIDAYGETASLVLAAAGIVERQKKASLRLIVEYSAVDQVQYILTQYEATIIDRVFAQNVEIHAEVAESIAPALREALKPHTQLLD